MEQNSEEKEQQKPLPFRYGLGDTRIGGWFNTFHAMEKGQTAEQIRSAMMEQGENEEDIEMALQRGQGIYDAYNQGFSLPEIRRHLVSQLPQITSIEDVYNMDPAQALDLIGSEENPKKLPPELIQETKTSLFETRMAAVAHMEGRGMLRPVTDETAENYIYGIVNKKRQAYQDLISLDNDMSLTELLAAYRIVRPNMSSYLTRTMGELGFKESRKIAIEAEEAYRQKFQKAMREEYGLDMQWVYGSDQTQDPDMGSILDTGYWMLRTPEGQQIRVDESTWDEIKSEGGAFSGAVGGGIRGAMIPGPPLVKLGGSVFGAAVGATVGSIWDTGYNAWKMHEYAEADAYAINALNQAQLSVVGDLLGYGIAESVGGAYRKLKGVIDNVIQGNEAKARQGLKEQLRVGDDVLEDTYKQLERVFSVPGETPNQQEIAAFILTQPGGEQVMRVAGAIDNGAQREVAKSIDERAKGFLAEGEALVPENFERVMKQDLLNYESDVKGFFKTVKDRASTAALANKWEFDFQELGIEPILKRMEKDIDDQAAHSRFLRKLDVIMNNVDDRSLSGLLELRKTINGFRYGRAYRKAGDKVGLGSMIEDIDRAIEEGAISTMGLENGGRWLNDWREANHQYANMLKVQDSMLYKVLNRKGITSDVITKNLSRYIESIDDTWVDVVSKLPPQMRDAAEGAVMDHWLKKFTIGDTQGIQAIHFPMLSEKLQQVTFTSPYARKLKNALIEMGNTFKNDTNLALQSGNITIPKNKTYLTTDPVVRMKFEVANMIFHRVKSMFPTQDGRAITMIQKVNELLENPLEQKTAKEIMEMYGEDDAVLAKLVEMQNLAKQRMESGNQVNVHFAETSKPGVYRFVKGTDNYKKRINASRIAQQADINRVLEQYAIHKSDIPRLKFALKEEGYQAMMLGTDRVEALW